MNQKIEITKYIAEQFGLDTSDRAIQKLIPQWWQNPRKKEQGGLRLTDEGFARLSAHIKAHEIKLEELLEYTNQKIIQLDNFITCPWYIGKRAIYVFDDKMAVQLVLFSGNVSRFLAAKAGKPLTRA